MDAVKVELLRVTDEAFPGFAECALVDCRGRRHLFRDKLPVFLAEGAPERAGAIRCRVVERRRDTAVIDTSWPDGLFSEDGACRFEVAARQLAKNGWPEDVRRPLP